jgi:hypothetical protein
MKEEETWVFDKDTGEFTSKTIRGTITPLGVQVILSNAFSLSMLPPRCHCRLDVFRITEENVKMILTDPRSVWISAVGHDSTAELLSNKLGINIPVNRVTVNLNKEKVLLVAQLMGPRKECREMSQEEIEKYPIDFFLVYAE